MVISKRDIKDIGR